MDMFPEDTFVPLAVEFDEWDEWTDALVYGTRMEAHRIASDDSDHAAARRLNLNHIEYDIQAPQGSRVLAIRLEYAIEIRRKTGLLLPGEEVIRKSDRFDQEQIARIINGMPEKLRHTAADDLALGYIRLFEPESNSDGSLMDEEWSWDSDDTDVEVMRHRVAVIDSINKIHPGQLERLYKQIQTGTL